MREGLSTSCLWTARIGWVEGGAPATKPQIRKTSGPLCWQLLHRLMCWVAAAHVRPYSFCGMWHLKVLPSPRIFDICPEINWANPLLERRSLSACTKGGRGSQGDWVGRRYWRFRGWLEPVKEEKSTFLCASPTRLTGGQRDCASAVLQGFARRSVHNSGNDFWQHQMPFRGTQSQCTLACHSQLLHSGQNRRALIQPILTGQYICLDACWKSLEKHI